MSRERPRVAIITGGSHGIGAGLVQGYRQHGWSVEIRHSGMSRRYRDSRFDSLPTGQSGPQ